MTHHTVEHLDVDLAGVRLHVACAGQGPPVLFLHGFPEFWYSWRHQIQALAEAGYRAIAPDMRGYNLSEKPRGVRSYRMSALVADVEALLDHLEIERVALVGHDWGAAVAWHFAMAHPHRLERLAILNVPHPLRMLQGLRTLRQLRKSLYIFQFQLPFLPERMISADDFAFLRRMLQRDTVRRGAFGEEDIELYVEALARPGALRSALNYYRATVRQGPFAARRALRKIDAPVLVLWGERDRYLGSELATPPSEWVPRARVEFLADASHWVQVDRPERVNELLLEFLNEARTKAD